MTENALQETEFPKIRTQNIKEHFVFRPRWGWAFAFSFLVLALKNDLADVFYPLLYNEDGRNIFGLFYNDHSVKNIFASYSSYYQVLPRLAGYVLHFLPVTWIPSLYSLFALLFSALAYSLFFPLLNRLFRSSWFALYSVLILTALPLASHKLVGGLMFQVWNSVIILGVATFLPMPKKLFWKMLYLFGINILIWSHPYCILILPVYLYKLAFQKDDRWVYGFFILSIFVYFGLNISHHPLNWDSLRHFPSSLLGRVAHRNRGGSPEPDLASISGKFPDFWFSNDCVCGLYGRIFLEEDGREREMVLCGFGLFYFDEFSRCPAGKGAGRLLPLAHRQSPVYLSPPHHFFNDVDGRSVSLCIKFPPFSGKPIGCWRRWC